MARTADGPRVEVRCPSCHGWGCRLVWRGYKWSSEDGEAEYCARCSGSGRVVVPAALDGAGATGEKERG